MKIEIHLNKNEAKHQMPWTLKRQKGNMLDTPIRIFFLRTSLFIGIDCNNDNSQPFAWFNVTYIIIRVYVLM